MGPIGVIPVVIIFLSFGINNFNALSVEIRLMTNVKKISIFLYYLIFVSIIVAFILELSLIFTAGVNITNYTELFTSSVAAFVVALGITIGTFVIIFIVVKLMGYKKTFFIKDDSLDENKWFIIRRVDSQRILLSDNDNSFKFIQLDDLKDITITSEDVQLKELPSNIENFINKNKLSIYLICLISLLASILIIEFVKSNVWYCIGCTLLAIDIIFFVIVITIATDVKEINNNT